MLEFEHRCWRYTGMCLLKRAFGKSLFCILAIALVCLLISATHASNGDSEPPAIDFASLTVTPKSVAVGESVTVSATVTDNLSGVSSVSISYRSPSDISCYFSESYRGEGERLSVDFTSTLEISPYDVAGVWQISSISLRDHAGNSRSYRRADIVNPGQYDFTVNNLYGLSALTVSPGSLSPAFDPATTAYTVEVDPDISSVNFTATLADDNATLTIDGTAASSGVARAVNLGAAGTSTPVAIVVTAAGGTNEKTYTVAVNRAGTTIASPQYIYYENDKGDIVRADYRKAVKDAMDGDSTLYGAIRSAIIETRLNDNQLFVENTEGNLVAYKAALDQGIKYFEAISNPNYRADPQNPVKELVINPLTGEPEEREL